MRVSWRHVQGTDLTHTLNSYPGPNTEPDLHFFLGWD